MSEEPRNNTAVWCNEDAVDNEDAAADLVLYARRQCLERAGPFNGRDICPHGIKAMSPRAWANERHEKDRLWSRSCKEPKDGTIP
jgi:hypothetical protein